MRRAASPHRLWNLYGAASIVLILMATVVVTGFLLSQVLNPSQHWFVPGDQPTPGHADATLMLVYMTIALGFAVVVHEFAHGILSFVARIHIESIGILLVLLPIGAFVEPSESQLRAASRPNRLRLYAAGPGANILLGVIFAGILVLFVAPSAVPAQPQGAVITEVAMDSPAYVSGIATWSEITSVGGTRVTDASGLTALTFDRPGSLVSVNLTREGRGMIVALPGGVAVTRVLDGPALNAGMRPGMIISRLDGVDIHSVSELSSTIERATHDRPVGITVLSADRGDTTGSWFREDPHITTVNLTSKWLFYYTHYPSSNREEYKNLSTMGIAVSPFGLSVVDPSVPIRGIAHPFAGIRSLPGLARASVDYLGQPFMGYSPVDGPIADLYVPSGVLAPLPHDIYWLMVNIVYWAFWANIVLGVTNALPVLPMDGGLVLGDSLKGLAHRAGGRLTGLDRVVGRQGVSERQIDRVMVGVTVIISVLLFYLLLMRML